MRYAILAVLVVGCGEADPVTSSFVAQGGGGAVGTGGAVQPGTGGSVAHAGAQGSGGAQDSGAACGAPVLNGCWRLENVETPIDCVSKCASLSASHRFEPFVLGGNTYGGGV